MNNYLHTLSKKCANKYQNTSHKEDLVSVGVLAALEELDSNPEAQPARLWQVISTAQWKHLNVDCLPVSLPFNLVRVAKGLGSSDDKQGFTDATISWATLICNSPQFDSSYHEGDTEANHAEEYAEKALLEDIWEAAKECLTEEEYDLFNYYFQQGMDQEYLAQSLSISQQAVSQKFIKMCEKVRKCVVNK